MSTLAVPTRLALKDIETVAANLAQSGYFSDAKEAAQAYAKILAGQELGIPPFAAMADIHIVKGKPTIGAGLMAAKIKQSSKYDYRVLERSAEAAEVAFYEGGDVVGTIRYTAADAKRDGNTGGAWVNHRDNMLFKTCITKGYRTYCPDVFLSAVYIHEEMGLLTDDEDNVIEVEVAQTQSAPPQTASTASDQATITPKQISALAKALKVAGFGTSEHDKTLGRSLLGWLADCEPVDDIRDMPRACAERPLARIEAGDINDLVEQWAVAQSEMGAAAEAAEAGERIDAALGTGAAA